MVIYKLFLVLWNSHSQILDFQLRKWVNKLQQWANGVMGLQEKYASRCFKLQDAYLFIYTVIYIYIYIQYIQLYVFIVNLIFYRNLVVMSNILKPDRPGMGASLGWSFFTHGEAEPMTKAIVCLEIPWIKQVNLHIFTLPCNIMQQPFRNQKKPTSYTTILPPFAHPRPTHEAKDRSPIHRPTRIPARARLDASNCPLCHGFETSFLFNS